MLTASKTALSDIGIVCIETASSGESASIWRPAATVLYLMTYQNAEDRRFRVTAARLLL